MKNTLKVIAWGSGILVFAVAGLVGVNAIDESLSPEAQKLLAVSNSTIKDEDNAYFAVWGMTAAEGADPHAVGRRIAQVLLDKRSGPDWIISPAAYESEIRKLKVSTEVAKLCAPAEQDCYAKLAAATVRAEALAGDHKTLLERYGALRRYKGYFDTTPPHVVNPIVPWKDFSDIAELDMVLAIDQVKRGDIAAGIARIESGVATNRMLLASPEHLMIKMIGARNLHRYITALVALTGDYPGTADVALERIDKLLAPLSPEERNLQIAMGYEFKEAHKYIGDLASTERAWEQLGMDVPFPPWLLMRFLQPKATANVYASMVVEDQRLIALPADRLIAELPRHQQKRVAALASLQGFSLLNPVGRSALGLGLENHDGHLLRLHDLDARLRLAALAVEIRARKLAPKAIGAFVASTAAPAVDPYTGKAFYWDEEKRELSSTSREKDSRFATGGRFVIRL